MGRVRALLRNNTRPLLGIAAAIAVFGVVLLLVGRSVPAWPFVLATAAALFALAAYSRPARKAPVARTPAKHAAATDRTPTVAAAPKPAKTKSTWASRELFTSMPRNIAPMEHIAGSQASAFSIATKPFDVDVSRTGTLPSFAYKVQESMRMMRHASALGGSLRVLRHDKKHDGYAFARTVGVSVPEIYLDRVAVGSIDFAALPDRVVLKPVRGAASRGVFLLQAIRPGVYLDHMNGTEVSVDDILARFHSLQSEGLVSTQVVAEEFLAPHPSVADIVNIPDDLKVFAFYDRPAVIMQRRCFGSSDASVYRFRFWDAEWNDLGPVKYADRIDPHMPPPELRDEVIEVVQRLGKALAVPFARIDVYETARGVVFGEFTPHPGPPAGWRADLDRLLGYEWEIAQTRLAIDQQPTIIKGR